MKVCILSIAAIACVARADIIRCEEIYSTKKEIAVKCLVKIIGNESMSKGDYISKATEEARGAVAAYVMPDVCYQTVNIKTSDHMISTVTQTLSVSYSKVYPMPVSDPNEYWGIGYTYQKWIAFKASTGDILDARLKSLAKCESSGKILSEHAAKNMKYDQYSNRQTLKGIFAFASLTTFAVAGMMYLSHSESDTQADRSRQANALKWSAIASTASVISLCF